MAWRRYRISNGHDTLDNEALEADAIPALLSRLKTHFGPRFQTGSRAGLSLSAFAEEILIDHAPLTLGWDNWSGLFIMAHDGAGDDVLNEMETLLKFGEAS